MRGAVASRTAKKAVIAAIILIRVFSGLLRKTSGFRDDSVMMEGNVVQIGVSFFSGCHVLGCALPSLSLHS